MAKVINPPKPELKPDILEINLLRSDICKQIKDIRFNSENDYQYKDDDKTYVINKTKLLKKNKPLFKRGIRNSYICIFLEDSVEPFIPDFNKRKISGRLQYIAIRSTQMREGLKGLFKMPFSFPLNWKTLLMIGVVVIVIVGVIIMYQGGMIQI